MEKPTFSLVDRKVLLKVYSETVGTKQCITSAEAADTPEVARMAGISRNVFYGYKDSVYPYQSGAINRILIVQAMLYDRPGALMLLVSGFCGAGVNILTINRNIPVSGKTIVLASTRINNMMGTIDELLALLRSVDGVCSVDNIIGQQRIGSISFWK